MQMAHDYALKQMESLSENSTMQSLVSVAWQYADAMQAEADKRAHKEPRETHKNLAEFKMYPEYDASINYPPDAWVMYRGEERLAVSIEKDWQPDWNQAPEWANWWTMDKNKLGIWHNKIPCNKQSTHEWVIDFSLGSDFSYKVSPDFNYQGNWKDSLRKRPQ